MKHTINILDALCESDTILQELIDYLVDSPESLVESFTFNFDADYECDTEPLEVGIHCALTVDRIIKLQPFYRPWMFDAVVNAVTEYEKWWRKDVLSGKIQQWQVDDEYEKASWGFRDEDSDD